MTIEQLLAALTAAGATRVRIELDFAGPLPAEPPARIFPADTAPRAHEAANAQAESHTSHSESEEDPEQQAKDLELAHLDP